MKHISLYFFLLLVGITSNGQQFVRLKTETVKQFVERIKPASSVIAHKVIQTNTWNNDKGNIIVFYSKDTSYVYEDTPEDTLIGKVVTGFLYFQNGDRVYQKVVIDNFNMI